MRLGAPVEGYHSGEEWAQMHVQLGYGAAYCPLTQQDGEAKIDEYLQAARAHDLVIAEVGIWNNLLDRDPEARKANFRYAVGQLKLADRVGARVCVNISGSHSARWDGPHPENLTEKTFREIVEITQRIIDEAAPVNTYYALEPMPWMYPCDAESYLRLIECVNRDRFAVHVDMCNLVNGMEKVYHTGDMTRNFFKKLAPHIRSVHAKDTVLRDDLTFHIGEAIPGEGIFDYDALLAECAKLPDLPVMAEHLAAPEQYLKATRFIRSRADALGLSFTCAR